jgi:hypothetical protein
MIEKHSDLLKNKILELIQRQGPITAQMIARMVPIAANDPIRIIRKEIRNLILEDRLPIASSMHKPMGYFIVTQDASAQHYVRQLKSRIMKIAQRLSAFEKSTADQIQGILFPEEVKK